MERESFEDQEVASFLNEHFLPIKVDREELPYVDHAYMSVCQIINGQGGWPLSVFATPDKEPFFAGTYFPRYPRANMPGFLDILKTIAIQWKRCPQKLITSGKRIVEAINQAAVNKKALRGAQFEDLIRHAKEGLMSIFDGQNGGFGNAPKFPSVPFLDFLLTLYEIYGEKGLLEMVAFTLKKMRLGGIFDHLGGGFHRYSVDERWFAPHFEKMLYDQALLISIYLKAYGFTGYKSFRETAIKCGEYCLSTLFHEKGGFYSAQDADTDGIEGGYYLWSEDEIRECLGDYSSSIETFISLFNVKSGGNFEHGKNILFLKKEPSKEQYKIVSDISKRLFACRSKRNPPLIDKKIITSWNGLIIIALLRLFEVTKEKRYLLAAQKTGDFLIKNLFKKEVLYRSFCDGEIKFGGVLDDYSNLSLALVMLKRYTGQSNYLKLSEHFLKICHDRFYSKELETYLYADGGNLDIPIKLEPPGDSATPSPLSTLLMSYIALYKETENTLWLDLSEDILIKGRKGIEDSLLGYCSFLEAYLLFERAMKDDNK